MTDDTRVQKLLDIPPVTPVPPPVAPVRGSRRTFYLAAVGVLALAVGAGSLYLLRRTPAQTQPVPVPVAVEVIASSPNASAEDIEKQVIVPLEVALAGIPYQKATWSKALPGQAIIRILFEEGTDYQTARQEVI